jgi:hypothetical protein
MKRKENIRKESTHFFRNESRTKIFFSFIDTQMRINETFRVFLFQKTNLFIDRQLRLLKLIPHIRITHIFLKKVEKWKVDSIIVLTLHKLFQNPIIISIKEETNQLLIV